MIELALVAAGLAVGGGLGWIVTRATAAAAAARERETVQSRLAAVEALHDDARRQLAARDQEVAALRATLVAEGEVRAQAEARAAAARLNLEEQRRLLDEARERLAETFRALSADALQQSGTALIERARESLAVQLGRGQESIDGAVKPLHDALRRYEEQARAMEAARQQAYGSLEQQLRTLTGSQLELQRETGALVAALRTPHVRGRWGELTLQRAVELAGMTEHCDYVEQVTLEGEGGRQRPDMVVRLPAGREIVVDAKVPLSAYLDAMGARSAEERAAALQRHAQQVRQHMTVLAGKAYWEEFAKAADLVVMFIPGESFVAAAVEVDPSLLEDGMTRRVVVATPTTLIALLRAIAFGWRQEHLATSAAEISELGRQLYERLRSLATHFDDLGTALGRATAVYNRAVGSMETRVLPAARRFRDLGAATSDEIPVLEAIEEQPRAVTAPELSARLDAAELGS